jgi:chemotaxis protein MotB
MKHRPLTLLGAVVCVCLALTGCVAQSTYSAKAKEAEDLRVAASEAEARSRDMGQKIRTLTAERDRLQGEVQDLTQKYQVTLGQSETLRKETEQKEQEIARLKSTYDALVGDLKKEIEAGEIKVTQFRDLLTVNLVEKILFDSGKAEIKPRGLEILSRVGEILKNTKDKQIRVEGHTDNVPIGPGLAAKFPTNWELSTARATVVARYFQDKVGIAPERLAAAGFAEYRPVAPNTTPEGKAQNRRIEIILAPIPPTSATR